MNEFDKILNQSIDYSPDLISNLLVSLFSVFVLWLVRYLILKFALARTENVTARHQWLCRRISVPVLSVG